MSLNDAHCHFFSSRFFESLVREAGEHLEGASAERIVARLGWDPPGTPDALADRWCAELDRHGVGRAVLIASVPEDEASVAAAVTRHPGRFVGYFMLNPVGRRAIDRAASALATGLRGICLFPAMHRYRLDGEAVRQVFELAAAHPGTAVFAHCGVLSVGVRTKLGLPSPFDLRLGQPLDLLPWARRYSAVPVIVPHFGAGFFREALMLADACPNVNLDTSSSNGWVKYHPGLSLREVFRQALEVVGPDRLLFGTDSSFFPRGWVKAVHEGQRRILEELEVEPSECAQIFGGNFDRLFPGMS